MWKSAGKNVILFLTCRTPKKTGRHGGACLEYKTELNQVVYRILLLQIQFGAYRAGESLPSMEEAAEWLLVSVDTVRAAYLRLKQEGHISLSKNVGAVVRADGGPREAVQAVRSYFASRRESLLDLCRSLRPLFGCAQWTGLKNASPETIARMERLAGGSVPFPYAALQHLEQKYAALGNDLLMRLVWQMFMLFQAPFYSVPEHSQYLARYQRYILDTLALRRRGEWTALRARMDGFQDEMSAGLLRFYEEMPPAEQPEPAAAFYWSAYRKSSQICYSLAMELLIAISRGVYPAGELLPSLSRLSAEKGVSVSTARRALALLNSIGAAKSIQRVGTRVVPPDQAAENCDFGQPAVRQRLLGMAESLQIFALSCREVSERTLASLDAGAVGHWERRFRAFKQSRQYELVAYSFLEMIARSAPEQTIRTVYAELLLQLFWGYPLRSTQKELPARNAAYEPLFGRLSASLERRDIPAFSADLEELVLYELKFVVERLLRRGIPEAGKILIPERDLS